MFWEKWQRPSPYFPQECGGGPWGKRVPLGLIPSPALIVLIRSTCRSVVVVGAWKSLMDMGGTTERSSRIEEGGEKEAKRPNNVWHEL